MKYVSKEAYKTWENKVIDEFYTNKRKKTKLIPTNENASVVQKKKIGIMIDLMFPINGQSLSEIMKSSCVPPKPFDRLKKIKLYHIGKQTDDYVDIGLNDKDDFLYPVCDFGGLTNVKHNDLKLIGKEYILRHNEPTNKKTIKDIYDEWKRLSKKKRFYGNMLENLQKFIEHTHTRGGLLKEYNSIKIRYTELPKDHRIIVTSYDIQKRTGKYYLRNFGGDNNRYAYETDSDVSMFCGITDHFINTNINMNNIRNEYTTYTVT